MSSKETIYQNTPQSEYFRLWLQKEYTRRSETNPKYSLRAFADHIGLDSSFLSKILNNKRRITPSTITKICNHLNISEHQREPFLAAEKTYNQELQEYRQISLDHFIITSDWYYFAILELTSVADFQSKPTWIAKQLNLTVTQTKIAIERLLRVGLLVEANREWSKAKMHITNNSKVDTSAAHKKLQNQLINKALDAIESCPQEAKDITSVTMAIDPNKLGEAKKKIMKFRRELCKFLENGNQKKVYNMGIQLYPLTKESK